MDESDLYELLEGAGDAAFVVDQHGIIRYWSRKAEELLGFRREEAVQKYCADVMAGIDESGALCCRECRVIDAARRNGAVAAYDARFATASGEHRWVNVGILVARLNRNRTTMVVHLMRDLEPRKQMELITRDILIGVGRLTGQQVATVLRRGRDPAPAFPLTPREKTILNDLSLGQDLHQISSQHNISPATVRNHIQHILTKLQCHSRLEAVVRAIREGVI